MDNACRESMLASVLLSATAAHGGNIISRERVLCALLIMGKLGSFTVGEKGQRCEMEPPVNISDNNQCLPWPAVCQAQHLALVT